MSSEFFTNYPRIAYDITGSNSRNPDFTVAVNIMVKNRLREAIENDVTVYYPYVIPEGMRPDVLSYQYYGSTIYTWSIFLVNNIVDPLMDWPLDYKDFKEFLVSKYGSIATAQSQVHHYDYIARARTEKTGTSDAIPEYRIEIDYETWTQTDESERDIVYAYEYERDKNEAKREIQIISKEFIRNLQDEVRGIFR